MVYLLAVAIQVAPTRPAVPNQRLQESLDPALLALRQQWEQLLRQDVQHLSNEEATWRRGVMALGRRPVENSEEKQIVWKKRHHLIY